MSFLFYISATMFKTFFLLMGLTTTFPCQAYLRDQPENKLPANRSDQYINKPVSLIRNTIFDFYKDTPDKNTQNRKDL